jgi:hypothetical protein
VEPPPLYIIYSLARNSEINIELFYYIHMKAAHDGVVPALINSTQRGERSAPALRKIKIPRSMVVSSATEIQLPTPGMKVVQHWTINTLPQCLPRQVYEIRY